MELNVKAEEELSTLLQLEPEQLLDAGLTPREVELEHSRVLGSGVHVLSKDVKQVSGMCALCIVM